MRELFLLMFSRMIGGKAATMPRDTFAAASSYLVMIIRGRQIARRQSFERSPQKKTTRGAAKNNLPRCRTM